MAEPILQYALVVDVGDGSHELRELPFPQVIGPVDFGWAMAREGDHLCIGAGVLAGSILPGSNRLVFTGRSPAWGGFYVSTMGGAALLWDGTGINFLAIGGRAARPSALILRGVEGGFPKVSLVPVELEAVWAEGGFYGLQRHVFDHLWEAEGTPRVLAVGPAARHTAFGAIGSGKTRQGEITPVDCWAGRGGLGSRLLQRHNVCAVIYGGDFEDEDLSDRAEANGYFQRRFSKEMKLVDLEATTKYRYDPKFHSGGTFGVNYSRLCDMMLSFNYRSVGWPRARRQALWERLVRDHYLRQFNEETIEGKQQSQCGEPCPAVCKKLHGEYKKDYEPYQVLGPLAGVFDQRVAEELNHRADALGFDGIQIGGQVSWVLECLHEGLLTPPELGLPGDVPERPVFEPEGFEPQAHSAHNGRLARAVLELCARPEHLLSRGMRAAAHAWGPAARELAVYLAHGAEGWMVPNQYWAAGMFAPGWEMGRYYTDYGSEFRPPEELGRASAERMIVELTTDNAGMCRFHRGWSEKLWAEIVQGHFGMAIDFPGHHARLAKQLHRQGQPVFWESARIAEIIHGHLRNAAEESPGDARVATWLERFEADRPAAARAFWEAMRAGIEARMAEIADGDA